MPLNLIHFFSPSTSSSSRLHISKSSSKRSKQPRPASINISRSPGANIFPTVWTTETTTPPPRTTHRCRKKCRTLPYDFNEDEDNHGEINGLTDRRSAQKSRPSRPASMNDSPASPPARLNPWATVQSGQYNDWTTQQSLPQTTLTPAPVQPKYASFSVCLSDVFQSGTCFVPNCEPESPLPPLPPSTERRDLAVNLCVTDCRKGGDDRWYLITCSYDALEARLQALVPADGRGHTQIATPGGHMGPAAIRKAIEEGLPLYVSVHD